MAHKHWFSPFPQHFGPYGSQDVHYHPCIEGEPGECWRVVIGPSKNCDGNQATHERKTLTEDGLKSREAPSAG